MGGRLAVNSRKTVSSTFVGLSALRLSRRGRFSLLAVVACATFAGLSRDATGFSWFTFGGTIVTWPTATDTRWLSTDSFPPGSDASIAVLGAAGAWNLAGGSTWSFSAGQASISPPDQFDGISYTEAVPASYFDDPRTLAVTLLGNVGADWVDMDTLFNAEAPNNWQWTTDFAPGSDVLMDPATYGFSLMLVAMHEFGHALGLGHEDNILCLMNSFYPNGGTFGQENIIEPHADDRAGLRSLYPGGIFTDLGNANFHRSGVGASRPILFTPTVADPGDQLAIRIQIENLGTTLVTNVRQGFYLSTDNVIDTGDLVIGSLQWDSLQNGGAGQFDVLIDLPAVLASGDYYLGSILDDLNNVTEAFEDNNATVYSVPLTIRLLPPIILDIPDSIAPCGQLWVGPTPQLVQALNMTPVTWTLESAPAGMTVNPTNGVVTWSNPTVSGAGHLVTLRATNAMGIDETSFLVSVALDPPRIAPIANQSVSCGNAFASTPPSLADPECGGSVFPWTLDVGPVGMTIDFATGVTSWAAPTVAGSPHTVTIRAFNPAGSTTASFNLFVLEADLSANGVIDLDDLFQLLSCRTEPGGVASPSCACSDLDSDGDVDLHDFGRFQAAYDDGGR